MAVLIALAGLSGAGKTTAIAHFESLGLGQRAYLGEEVLKEVNSRGLARNPGNERSVRLSLRETEGPAVLAVRATPLIQSILAVGTDVFVDRIFDFEEYEYLKASFTDCTLILLGIIANFEIRSLQLASRLERPLSSEDLKVRDDSELSRLGTGCVVDLADHKIRNEGTLAALQHALEQFWKTVKI